MSYRLMAGTGLLFSTTFSTPGAVPGLPSCCCRWQGRLAGVTFVLLLSVLCRKARRNKVFLDFWKLGSEVCEHSLVLLVVVAVLGKTLKGKIRRAKFSCSEVIFSQS